MALIVKFFVDRSILVNLIIVTVFVLGIQSFLKMKKEGFPAVTQNQVVIQTVYPGASSKDVELNVTNRIEEELEKVGNVKEVFSTSKENLSIIRLVADEDLDKEQFSRVYDDVGSALAGVSGLPAGAENPTYRQITSDDIPIVDVAISGPWEELEVFVPFLYDELKKISGVSLIDKVGFGDSELHVLIDPDRADKNYVDLNVVTQAIARRNIEGSGGTLESYIGEKKVVAFNKYRSTDDILETNLRRNFNGEGVRLKDVASVKRAREDLKLLVRNDGERGVSLVVKKKPSADLLNTVDDIKNLVSQINTPINVRVKLLNDQSKFTRDRLKLLAGNALMGIGLVFLILSYVLGFRTAFWTAFSVPFSFLGMFAVLPFLGISLNSITLGGCVLVLGMLVDDAIVVAEQSSQEKEGGKEGKEAVVDAVAKVWKPVMGASITTIIAYFPILNLGGLPGKFVWIVPAVVAMTLLISLFETYFILPSHLVHGKVKPPRQGGLVERVEAAYRRILDLALGYRYFVLAIFLLFMVSAGLIARFQLNKDPFPQDAAEGFTIQLTMPPGVTGEGAESIVNVVEEQILALPKNELAGISARVGSHDKSVSNIRGSEYSLGVIFVYLTPFIERDRTASEILNNLKERVESELSDRKTKALFELTRLGPPMGRQFDVRVSGKDIGLVSERVSEIKEFLRNKKGVLAVDDDRYVGRDELNLEVDFDKIAELGISVSDVLNTIRIGFDGVVVSDMLLDNEVVDLRIRLSREGRGDVDHLKGLGILNKSGSLVRFKDFVKISTRKTLPEIHHYNGMQTVTVYGELDKEIISPGKVMDLVSQKFMSDHEIQIGFGGEPVENKKIFGNLAMAGVTAIIGVFLVIALILNSYGLPLIVMSAVPFGAVGIIYSVWAHQMPISMFVMISLIGLSGIIVNDSLVLVYTINELKKKTSTINAIVEGAKVRLRPVLLTSITTIFGLLPTAYAIGGYDPFISPMCLALSYGLLFGTAVILILIPVLYRVGEDLSKLTLFKIRIQS